jgi:ceramide glucosyltransferase
VTSLALLAGAGAARLALVATVDRALGAGAWRWALLPLRDLLSFAVFLASFLGRGVVWRDRRYAVGPSGIMVEGGDVPR